MKNIRPRYNAAQRIRSVRLTPVKIASRGMRWSARNGIDDVRLMRSSGGFGALRRAGRSRTEVGVIALQPTDRSVGAATRARTANFCHINHTSNGPRAIASL